MSKHPAFGYVEIDDGDAEHTHLWVTVNDDDGCVLEIIEQYPIEERDRAYRMALRLAALLKLPIKLKEGPFDDPRPIEASDFPFPT